LKHLVTAALVFAFVAGILGVADATEGLCVRAINGRFFQADGIGRVVVPSTVGFVQERAGTKAASLTVFWPETFAYIDGDFAGGATEINVLYSTVARTSCYSVD
jgi:hypothetical protein